MRDYKPTDYPTLALWWQIHGWPPVPGNLLPSNGLIVEGKAAGFLYLTDTPIAWLEYIVSNPLDYDKISRGHALDTIIDGLLDRAKQLGKTMVFTSTNHNKLAERLEKHGAILGDAKMSNYVWRLN